MNHRKKLQKVVDIISIHPGAADDDPLLYALYWESEGWDYSESIYYNLQHVTRPETITRRRRQAHQLGLIEYTAKSDKTRMEAMVSEQDSAQPWWNAFKH